MSAPDTIAFIDRLIELTQGVARVSEDNLQSRQVRAADIKVVDLLQPLRDALSLNAKAEIEAHPNGANVLVEAHADGWSVEEDSSGLFSPPKPRFGNAEVAARIVSGNLYVSFDKGSWGPPWVGWSVATFSSWLAKVEPHTALQELLSNGTARIALRDWDAAPVALGPTLTIGDLACRPPAEPPLDWPESAPPAFLRMALVAANRSPPQIAPQLRQASVWGGLSVLGEQVSDGRVIFDRRFPWQMELPLRTEAGQSTATWVQSAVEWVMEESNQTRLSVARQVIGEHGEMLATDADAHALVSRLTIAYRAAIDEKTSRALTALASFNSTMNDLARKVDSTTEDSITRIIAAILAILVGSVVAKDLEGWPLLVASLLVAFYPLWVGFSVFGGIRSDLARQRETIRQAFPPSVSDANQRMEFVGEKYAREITARLRFRQGLAVFVALGIVIVGILLYEHAGE